MTETINRTDDHTAPDPDRVGDAVAFFEMLFADDTDGSIRLALSDPTRGRGEEGAWIEPGGFFPGGHQFEDADWAYVRQATAYNAVKYSATCDVYVCPYPLRKHGPRRNGRSVERKWVHADIDGPHRADRAAGLGAAVIGSGGLADGVPKVHIYVALTESVPLHVHRALCVGLGQLVGDEHHDTTKVGDSDVLRIPGTLNHGYSEPSPVTWLTRPTGRRWEPEQLARLLGVAWPVPEAVGAESAPDSATSTPVSVGDAADGLHPYARAAIEAELALLDDLPRPWPGPGQGGWDSGTFNAACALIEIANSPWSGYTLTEAKADLMRHAPTDHVWTTRDVTSKWAAARKKIGGKSRPEPGGVTADEADAARLLFESLFGDGETGSGDDSGTEPAYDQAATTTETEVDEEAFWETRPMLRRIRDFSRARRVAPWAVLGSALARAAAVVHPGVKLPATIGSPASLNLFVAVCSASGGGKTAAVEASREVLDVLGGSDYLETQAGSGEGLAAAYVFTKTAKGRPPEIVQNRTSVLFDVDEISSIEALTKRSGNTLASALKSAWMGKQLGQQNAEASRLRRVEAHAYRLTVVCGVQPVNASAILDDAAGGFPQRWVWMPTYDPGLLPPSERPVTPPPFTWRVPVPPVTVVEDEDGTLLIEHQPEVIVSLPDVAVDAIHQARQATNLPIGAPVPSGADALDGHALLCRAKVAALLALLDGRVEVSDQDWALAGTVMAVSSRTRGLIVAAQVASKGEENVKRGAAEGRRRVVAEEVAEAETMRRAGHWALGWLIKRRAAGPGPGPGGDGWVSWKEIRSASSPANRKVLQAALAALEDAGQVESAEVEYRGQVGWKYRAAGTGGR
ncbi:hypothetical protein [Micropruina sp.]|uniref:hypothetical protein n=1 Tax=Micropruina sp. TaxID=2737536 RepID=UPI0039E2BEF1